MQGCAQIMTLHPMPRRGPACARSRRASSGRPTSRAASPGQTAATVRALPPGALRTLVVSNSRSVSCGRFIRAHNHAGCFTAQHSSGFLPRRRAGGCLGRHMVAGAAAVERGGAGCVVIACNTAHHGEAFEIVQAAATAGLGRIVAFALPLSHLIPDILTHCSLRDSVPLFMKRQRDRTLGGRPSAAYC